MKQKIIDRVRQFNRFYMPQFDLLGNHYLGSEYSAAEARVLYEIYTNDGCTAAAITRTMNLDKSYLSRVIRHHEKRGYLYRTPSSTDSRAYELHLTQAGKKRTEDFIASANALAAERIRPLSEAECKQLIEAFDTITNLLEAKS